MNTEAPIIEKQIARMTAPVSDDATAIQAVRDYIKMYGLVDAGEEITIPDDIQMVDGLIDLDKKCHERGVERSDMILFSMSYVFGELAECENAENEQINIQDIYPDKIKSLAEKVSGGALYVYKNDFGFLVRPPIVYKLNDDGDRHCEDGPFLAFSDGTKIYAINDIIVPDWVVEQKTASADQILGIEDVDVRAIALRKFGAQPLVEKGDLIDESVIIGVDDSENAYKLIDLGPTLGIDKAQYLSMESRCTAGLQHVEGVEAETVQEALNFRARIGLNFLGSSEDWIPLSLDGFENPNGNPDQDQQGDVCMIHLPDDFDYNLFTKLANRDFVLSPENQKRHSLVGNFNLYEKGDVQILECRGDVVLKHPEHGEKVKTGIWLVFPTSEKDWIKDEIHVTVD